MRQAVIAALAFAFFASSAHAASPCRDEKGKYVKCAPAKPAKCRDAKGKFTKCSASKSS